MGQWSVTQSDGPSLLVIHPSGEGAGTLRGGVHLISGAGGWVSQLGYGALASSRFPCVVMATMNILITNRMISLIIKESVKKKCCF